MPRILMAGLPPALLSRVAERLPQADVRAVAAGTAPDEWLYASEDLLILDHHFAGPDTPALLGQLRETLPRLPVIYCLESSAKATLVRRLIIELAATELLFYPLEPGTLAERAAALLGIPWQPRVEEAPAIPAGNTDGSKHDSPAGGWRFARSMMLESLHTLDQAAVAAQQATLDARQREQAAAVARRLAGSLDAVGLTAASSLGREVERLLETDSLSDELGQRRFAVLAEALRTELADSSALSAMPNVALGAPATALIVGSDAELAKRVAQEALARGWLWEPAPDPDTARAILSAREPAAVLIDAAALPGAATLDFLSELSARKPPIPAMILTDSGRLTDRVEVVRRGGCGFISRTVPPDEIVDAAAMLAGGREPPPATILAVDDDPAVIDTLRRLVTPTGVRLVGLTDPLRFWDALQGVPPDLLLLDLGMPGVNGLELCRAVRNDAEWVGVPVVFLTGHADADNVRRAFAAGADDLIAKPVVGPELLARINNRLERSRLARLSARCDSLTGLANGLRSRRLLQDLLRLAERHGQPLVLAILTVDGLQQINRDHGAAAGDDVLRSVGRHVRHEFHSPDLTARWGGNQFVLGIYGLDRLAGSRRLEAIVKGLAAEVFVGAAAEEFRASLSAGVAGYPDDADNLNGLYRRAEQGLRRARQAGGGTIRVAWSHRMGENPLRVDVAVASSDEATCSLLLHALEAQGYAVRVLRSAGIATRMLFGPSRALEARVLVLDAGLQGVDEIGLLQRFAADGALELTRVIVLTSPSGDDATKALAAGAADLVAKPFDLPVLLDRVRAALEVERA